MSALKKAVLGFTVLSHNFLFAGTMGPVCQPGPVTVPCEKKAWDIGVAGLYLRPILSANLGYNSSLTGPSSRLIASNYNWDWGYKLEGSYHFNTGNDIAVNWSHLDTDNDFLLGNSLLPSTAINSDLKWDSVNVELGQYVDFSANKKMRFHAGVNYSRINSHAADYASGQFRGTHDRVFNGFGPRSGLDLNYVFGNGIGIYAKPAAALLVGVGRFNNVPLLENTVLSGKKHAIVPEAEARLGIDYVYTMVQGDFSVDAGYMWFNYLGAQHNFVNVFGAESSYGGSGPYVGIKYVSYS